MSKYLTRHRWFAKIAGADLIYITIGTDPNSTRDPWLTLHGLEDVTQLRQLLEQVEARLIEIEEITGGK